MSKLNEIIGAEMARRGAIPFARYMDLALYCPVYGYYESEKDKIGREGDFGECLADRRDGGLGDSIPVGNAEPPIVNIKASPVPFIGPGENENTRAAGGKR